MRTKKVAYLFALVTPLYLSANSLDMLCKIGLEHNPKIKSYKHKVSASHSYYNQSKDQYMPHLNISGQYGYQDYDLGSSLSSKPYKGESYNYMFSVRQPIYRARLLDAIHDAQAREKLAKIEQKDQEARLVIQIVQSSIEILRDKKTVEVLSKKTKVLKKAYDNIYDKYKVQLASSADLFQAKAMLHQSQSELTQAKQKYDYNLFNLQLLTKTKDIKRYINKLDFSQKSLKFLKKRANIKTLKKLVNNNTQLKYYKQLIKIAKIQIDLRKSERLPQVDAVVSYADAGGSLDSVTRQNESKAMITLNFPIYQGGYVSDRVEEGRYLLMSSQEDYLDLYQNISISMEKSISNIQGGLESINAQNIALNASKKYFQSMVQSYKNGVASLTDTYLAESDYRDSQLKLINIEADVYLSIAEVYYYAGLTSIKDIQRLEKRYFKIK